MKKQLLLVEDDPNILRLLVNLINKELIDCSTATTGTGGLAALRKNQFDLVVTDENRPEVKGHQIAEWMRGQELYQRTPIILMTAEQNPSFFGDLMSRGLVSMIISKPYNIYRMRTMIMSVIAANSMRQFNEKQNKREERLTSDFR